MLNETVPIKGPFFCEQNSAHLQPERSIAVTFPHLKISVHGSSSVCFLIDGKLEMYDVSMS